MSPKTNPRDLMAARTGDSLMLLIFRSSGSMAKKKDRRQSGPSFLAIALPFACEVS
jgi:hypothetical protein